MLHANNITLPNPHPTVKEQLKLLEKLELITIEEKMYGIESYYSVY